MINMSDVYKYAEKNNFLKYSAIDNKDFRAFFKDIKIHTAVEIGVYKGMSSAYIAQFAYKVYAFDIVDYPEKYKIWNDLGVSNKISFHLIKSRCKDNIPKNFERTFEKSEEAIDIESILDVIKFDFAFVDGEHNGKDFEEDWKLVRKCGRVLFHDVDPIRFPELNAFACKIGTKIIRNIGYWELHK